MSYIYLSIVFFWAFHILQRVFYSLYMWQLKEYRIDRFREEMTRNKNIIFPDIVVISFLFLSVVMFREIDQWFLNALFVFYFLVGLKSIYGLMKRRWKFPVLTKKMILLISLVFIVSVFFFYIFLDRFPITIIIFEILIPILLFIVVLLLQIPTFFTKRYIFQLARKKRESFKDLIVIGVTGSYGKSSTKEFLYTILSGKYNVLKTEGNINTEIGIANTILSKLTEEHQVFICEMGAYKIGEIKRSSAIVNPKIGVLTGINQQHLALFGSQENIIKGKYELIEALPLDGIAFFNVNNEYCRKLYDKTNIKKETYGEKAEAPGEENIWGAVAVAKYLGMTEEEISKGFEKIKDRIGGIKFKEGINGLTVLDATYSANPDGILAHLEHIKKLPGKKIMIMPCLIELGTASSNVHQKIGEKTKGVCDLLIITSKDFYNDIKKGNPEAIYINNANEILKKINEVSSSGDVILLESRVPEKLKKMLIK
ncbi:MAG: UDP-N-acetylmuramoyl-tripeptide--D-alanyl-D-alanine ligase [Candidatus Nealsonbacteria bacterium]